MLAVYIDTNQFRIDTDHTGEFKTGRRVRANCGVDGYKYSTILSSSYSSPYTTVTIVENVLTTNLTDVLYGIINVGETGAFPDHLHDGMEGQGGSLPYITESILATYSGITQTQIDSKPDTFLELNDTPSNYSEGLFAQSTSSGIVWATISGGGTGSSDVQTFLDLTDVPSTYSGTSGMFAQSTGSGIVWTTVSGSEPISDHGLLNGLANDDHPQYIRHALALGENDFLVGAPPPFGTFVKKSLNETRELLGVTGSGIALSESFLDLTDTPDAYSDGMYAKSTTSGIVWATVSGGGTGTSYDEIELTYSSEIVLDFTTYNLQSVVLTGNTNFTFTGITNGKPCILNVIQDAQGSRSATFQSNIKWPQGVIPTTSSGSGLNDIFTFIQSRGTIYGDCTKAFQLGS